MTAPPTAPASKFPRIQLYETINLRFIGKDLYIMKFFDIISGMIEADTMTMMPSIKGMRETVKRTK